MTDLDKLAKIIRAHRISYADGHGTAKCSCGHHYGKLTDTRRAEHLAQAIIDAGWVPLKDKA